MYKSQHIKCSVVLTTFNKPESLKLVIDRLYEQVTSFAWELIVVYDGPTEVPEYARSIPFGSGPKCVHEIRTGNRNYRNPVHARNVGYRQACGDVIVSMCDDTIPTTTDVIERLVTELKDGEFLLAKTVDYKYVNGKPRHYVMDYCSSKRLAYFFFTGSIARKDLYAVGGNDEDFIHPDYDDNWFADCLMKGICLTPRIDESIVVHHMHHGRFAGSHAKAKESHTVYLDKIREAVKTDVWESSGGPWDYIEGEALI